jgi:hypothetical protein
MIMATIPFKYYMHDNANLSEIAEHIEQQAGVEISDSLMEKIGRPFYEIALNCTLDDETGEVKILGLASAV